MTIAKQNTPYGCGMYAVSNSLNLELFISDERLEKSKTGNTIYQLNKWLDEDGIEYNIECMYCTVFTNNKTNHGKVIPKECHIKSNDEKLICLLLNVNTTAESKNHIVAAWVDSNGHIFISDSCKEEMITTSWDSINEHYECVYGIWTFQDRSGEPNNYVSLSVEI